MKQDLIDWEALARLRTAFLEGAAGHADYWRSESDLSAYNATFAQRIGWKWDYVLLELQRRGWTPPPGAWLDWGCGTGLAGRACLDFFGRTPSSKLWLHDRSGLATDFALRRAQAKYPGLEVQVGLPDEPGLLLLSHVLTELQPAQTEQLVAEIVGRATAVIWVEPGTYAASHALITLRERLRGTFGLVAPCTHQQPCGLLAPDNHNHWCHHFAAPPPAVFTDGDWARFARMVGVDLRALPVSFLVLDRRPVTSLPAGATRILGRPRVYKGFARLLGCAAEGVHERELPKSALPETFRQLKKEALDPLQLLRSEGDRIAEATPLFPQGCISPSDFGAPTVAPVRPFE